MWNDEKQKRFDALRQKEAQGILNDVEAQELQELFAELDAEEAEMLRGGLKQMDARLDSLRADKKRVEAKNKQLESIVARQERLLKEARNYLTYLRRKKSELRVEYHAVTGRKSATSP